MTSPFVMPSSGNITRSVFVSAIVTSPNVSSPDLPTSVVRDAGERGQLALVEEQALAAVAPVVLDIAGTLERDHLAVALVTVRRGRAALVGRDDATLDDVRERELLDHVVLALVEDDPAAAPATVDLDEVN